MHELQDASGPELLEATGYVEEDGQLRFKDFHDALLEAKVGKRGIWLFEAVEHPSDYQKEQHK